MIEVEICTDVYVEIAVITNKHTIFFNIKCKYANYANYTWKWIVVAYFLRGTDKLKIQYFCFVSIYIYL